MAWLWPPSMKTISCVQKRGRWRERKWKNFLLWVPRYMRANISWNICWNPLHFLSRVTFWDSSCLPEITCMQIFASHRSLSSRLAGVAGQGKSCWRNILAFWGEMGAAPGGRRIGWGERHCIFQWSFSRTVVSMRQRHSSSSWASQRVVDADQKGIWELDSQRSFPTTSASSNISHTPLQTECWAVSNHSCVQRWLPYLGFHVLFSGSQV